MTTTRDSYQAKDITVLEGLEAVRRRPGMYIGSTGPRGLHHLVWEVVDNSVDEAMAGHCTKISVTLRADGGVEVVDDGRGIPVDRMEKTKQSALTTILTTLHAGGKPPAAFIREQGRRIQLVHLKDEKELGTGPVDFPAVFAALDQVQAVEWLVIEVEKYSHTPIESVARSFNQLRAWGRA